MNDFWRGFLLFPALVIALTLVLIFLARQSRAMFRWYIGLPVTRWWAMGLFVLSLKFLQQRNVRTMRAQGRIWFSPLVKEFEDTEVIT